MYPMGYILFSRDYWNGTCWRFLVTGHAAFRYRPPHSSTTGAASAPSMSPVPFKSTFYSSILHRARCAPHAIAVSFGAQDVSYGEFVRDIERATRQLAARVPAGSGLAAVTVSHPYLHWVLTIALGRAGLCTATVLDGGHTLDLIKPDLVFADAGAHPARPRLIGVDQEWIGVGADALPAFADPDYLPDAPFRLILSSGTTGTPKKILLGHAQFQARLQSIAVGSGLPGEAASSLTLVGLDTVAGHLFPMTTWFVGGRTVLITTGDDPYHTMMKKRVNYSFMAPVQLEQLVNKMPATAWPIPELTVSLAGSSLPRLVSEKARARLTPSLRVLYGSTEAGLVTACHAGLADALPGVTGFVRPDVDLQIVGPDGQVLPHGATGEVRCRSLGCVTRYEDAAASGIDNDDTFRDGWFYPGDAGTLSHDGLLTIVGRTKELMNLGGVKILPNQIEAVLAACPGVLDLAAFALEVDGAVATPWVAVVRGPDYDQAPLSAAFAQAFPRLPALKIVHADLIPRNPMGKVQRNLIQEQVRRTLAGQ